MKHYAVIPIRRTDIEGVEWREKKIIRTPLAFRAETDTASFLPPPPRWVDRESVRKREDEENWWKNIEHHAPNLLGSIEKVEMQCNYRMNDEIAFWDAERFHSLFPGLKILLVTTAPPVAPVGGGDEPDRRDLDGVRGKAREWLETGLYSSCLPEIVVRFSRRDIAFVNNKEAWARK